MAVVPGGVVVAVVAVVAVVGRGGVVVAVVAVVVAVVGAWWPWWGVVASWWPWWPCQKRRRTLHDKKISCIMKAQKKARPELVSQTRLWGGGEITQVSYSLYRPQALPKRVCRRRSNIGKCILSRI